MGHLLAICLLSSFALLACLVVSLCRDQPSSSGDDVVETISWLCVVSVAVFVAVCSGVSLIKMVSKVKNQLLYYVKHKQLENNASYNTADSCIRISLNFA